MTLYYWVLYFIAVMMSAVGGVLLKLGALGIDYENGLFSSFCQIFLNWKICLGMFMYFVPVLIWIIMLKKIDLSYLQPLFSLMYIVTPLIAFFFLKENVPLLRWFGIGIVALGVLVIAKS
jgi:drug/metabolite transporter (DMT)-like permease